MKKSLLKLVALVAVICFTSCDMKLCYCYEATPESVYESEHYVNEDSPCGSLSHGDVTCVEQNERMNPEDIAHK